MGKEERKIDGSDKIENSSKTKEGFIKRTSGRISEFINPNI